MKTVLSILITLLIFTVIVVVHEGGHALVAKWTGTFIQEFSVGMGPRLFGWYTKAGTKISFRLLPIGGYCRMQSETTEDDTLELAKNGLKSVPGGDFNTKPVWKRFISVAAGPFMNFVLAIVLLTAVNLGFNYISTEIGAISPGSAAEEAGLVAGDRVIKIGKERIHIYPEISYAISKWDGERELLVRVRHADGSKEDFMLMPRYSEEDERYLIGFTAGIADSPKEAFAKGFGTGMKAIGENIAYSFHYLGYEVRMTLVAFAQLITGALGLESLTGPIGIVSMVSDTYEEVSSYGFWVSFATFASLAVLLSVNLGILNLFPIPALDGSRLVFLIVEKIRKKPMDQKVETIIYLIGFILLFGLMIFVAVKDVLGLF